VVNKKPIANGKMVLRTTTSKVAPAMLWPIILDKANMDQPAICAIQKFLFPVLIIFFFVDSHKGYHCYTATRAVID